MHKMFPDDLRSRVELLVLGAIVFGILTNLYIIW